jgi:hypothetical protein
VFARLRPPVVCRIVCFHHSAAGRHAGLDGDEDDADEGEGEEKIGDDDGAGAGEVTAAELAQLQDMQSQLQQLQRMMQVLTMASEGNMEGLDEEGATMLYQLLNGADMDGDEDGDEQGPREADDEGDALASTVRRSVEAAPVSTAPSSSSGIATAVKAHAGGSAGASVSAASPASVPAAPPVPAGDAATGLQEALHQLRELERQNQRLEELREVTQERYISNGGDDEADNPEAVEAHLAVLMTQLEVCANTVRGSSFLPCTTPVFYSYFMSLPRCRA